MKIDYKLILGVLHDMDHATTLADAEKKEWAKDSSLIFFPSYPIHDNRNINTLNTLQYLQRIRLLYPTLMRPN